MYTQIICEHMHKAKAKPMAAMWNTAITAQPWITCAQFSRRIFWSQTSEEQEALKKSSTITLTLLTKTRTVGNLLSQLKPNTHWCPAVKKCATPKNAFVKKDVKSKVAAKSSYRVADRYMHELHFYFIFLTFEL